MFGLIRQAGQYHGSSSPGCSVRPTQGKWNCKGVRRALETETKWVTHPFLRAIRVVAGNHLDKIVERRISVRRQRLTVPAEIPLHTQYSGSSMWSVEAGNKVSFFGLDVFLGAVTIAGSSTGGGADTGSVRFFLFGMLIRGRCLRGLGFCTAPSGGCTPPSTSASASCSCSSSAGSAPLSSRSSACGSCTTPGLKESRKVGRTS